MSARGMEFRVLGPLEVRVDGEPVPLGGAKQRAVLAVLLLNANRVISVDRLVDEVWGDHAPPSASHSLEAYVSRIRQLLNGHGPTLTRRGAGYRLDLGGAVLDSDVFALRLDDASEAAAGGHLERASELAVAALALWYGPALADVSLASAGRAEAERLEEHRLRAFELRFDALLELGRHEAIVGELQVLVGQNPYRERFVAQLMLALYRAGRQAEALEAYEQLRRRLDDDLGLQPSAELQQLSGQMVRQEVHLRTPMHPAPSSPRLRRETRRVATLVAGGVAAAAVMSLTASGSTPRAAAPPALEPTPVAAKHVALVLPRRPEAAINEPGIRYAVSAYRDSTEAWGHDSEILVADDIHPSPAAIQRTTRRLESGNFAAVLISGGGATARALAPLVRRLTDTTFVFLDASLATLSLEGVPNATGMPYADNESAQLVGYVSGLVSPRGGLPRERADMVSLVAAPRTPRVERAVRGFVRGARRALPRVAVRVDYAPEGDKTVCERLANEQVDAGSDVVFAMGRVCSSAALAVARLRGVWGMSTFDHSVPDGPHILARSYKRWEKSVQEALNRFELDSLPEGRDLVLGLADDYAVGLDVSESGVSQSVWSEVVRYCTTIRQHTLADAP